MVYKIKLRYIDGGVGGGLGFIFDGPRCRKIDKGIG